ncbi:MAG TPA: hypothetical protein VIY49_18240 [Bryobacteraceae bacterium]
MHQEIRQAQPVPAPQRTQPTSTPVPEPIAPVAARYMAAYQIAVDMLLEARTYAQRKGLPLEIRCEDVRCLAATLMIDAQRGDAR